MPERVEYYGCEHCSEYLMEEERICHWCGDEYLCRDCAQSYGIGVMVCNYCKAAVKEIMAEELGYV